MARIKRLDKFYALLQKFYKSKKVPFIDVEISNDYVSISLEPDNSAFYDYRTSGLYLDKLKRVLRAKYYDVLLQAEKKDKNILIRQQECIIRFYF